ncbi:MAG: preprotein translocase subunit SecY [Hungatella sp.]|nr:preprotein translocase subunit SecY [Hungatella sp.]
MTQTEEKTPILKYKLAYAMIIILVYLIGRRIPLCGVDVSAHRAVSGDAETLLIQAVGGDVNRYSLFTLGMSPYMLSMILIQILTAFRNTGKKVRLSPGKMNRMQIALTIVFAIYQAVMRVQQLKFKADGAMLLLIRTAAVTEMIAGVMLIMWLSGRNRKYGLGGHTILIYINILDGILKTLIRHSIASLFLPLTVAITVMAVTLIMEGGEKRIPMQRISIYNIYADKNYLAIKLNPVGIMPVMFSTAFFMLPQMAFAGLHLIFPENETIIWWQENLILTELPGIRVYIVILYLLTVGFAMIMISPVGIAEQFLKGGDSIMNLHAGRDTRRYLTRQVLGIGFFSATVMSICLGIPMLLQLKGGIDRELVMFPASVMMMTSLWYSIDQEFKAVKSFETYKPFI